MKLYVGEAGRVTVQKLEECIGAFDLSLDVRELPLRLDLRNHSPTGFGWGYGGSGPAQLALALLADVLGDDDRALRLYQQFKWRLIGGLEPDKPWAMSDTVIRRFAYVCERATQKKVAA